MSNPFFTANSNDVDDDEFLNHPRSGSSGYMLQHSNNMGASNASNAYRSSAGGQRGALGLNHEHSQQGEVDQVQVLMQKRREIEERTLDSSNRSLGLLFESERAGIETAEELNRQKEQLKRTEERLDDINSTLKTSERHLQGIKSVFGGIKNYFSSKNASSAALPSTTRAPGEPSINSTTVSNTASNNPYNSSRSNGIESSIDAGSNRLDAMRSENHPGLRTRGAQEYDNTRTTSQAVDDILDSNLDEMSLGLGRLKGLAQNLNEELDEHNDILDRLDDKTSGADWRVKKQNKDMDKLLNPKKK